MREQLKKKKNERIKYFGKHYRETVNVPCKNNRPIYGTEGEHMRCFRFERKMLMHNKVSYYYVGGTGGRGGGN